MPILSKPCAGSAKAVYRRVASLPFFKRVAFIPQVVATFANVDRTAYVFQPWAVRDFLK